MFKLIKIENSGVNVPEPITVNKEIGITFPIGTAITISGGLASGCDVSEKPTHITYNEAPEDAEELLCYRITSDMLFEVPLAEGPEIDLHIGDKLMLATDDDDNVIALSPTYGGPAEIADTPTATVAGDKITVRF
ncbi:MAG: hypothetical protein IKD45_01040 [Clostridia bacterium]|nr:hypothetical protein [Clostridia bacterium]